MVAFVLGLVIGASLGVLTLGACTSGKTEDLYNQLADEKRFFAKMVEGYGEFCEALEKRNWELRKELLELKKGSDQDGICL